MKKIMIFVIVVLLLVMTTVPAFAHPGDAEHNFAAHGLDNSAPVGKHLLGDVPGAPGGENGFGNPNSNALTAIANNPLCPAHHAQHVH